MEELEKIRFQKEELEAEKEYMIRNIDQMKKERFGDQELIERLRRRIGELESGKLYQISKTMNTILKKGKKDGRTK